MPAQLIEPLQLAQAIAAAHTRPLVIFDCRHDLLRPDWGRDEYAKAHIPGAIFAHLDQDLSGPLNARSGRHPLPAVADLATFLGASGVDADTDVVAYDQDKSPYAARLWWLLQWLGHERVAVLNGGLAAWRAAGLPLESEISARQPRPFRPNPARVQVATTAEVERELKLGSVLLLDARPADRFAGRNETIDPVAGHVPGARNFPFAQNLSVDGRLQPVDVLTKLWEAALGDTDPSQVIAMCGSGVTACHNLLAMQLAGLPGARLYAGSFSEWIRDPGRRVATGPV